MNKKDKEQMEKIGYRFAGPHAAVKVCTWVKNSLRGKGTCYKEKFYGIKSHRCVQMSPCIQVCNHNCIFCWRDTSNTKTEQTEYTKPKDIVDNCIKEQIKLLQGFKSHFSQGLSEDKFREARLPRHFAISLDGEPTLYPKLAELINEIKSRDMTAYVVSNGTHPEILNKLINKAEPTQLYITLPAPDEKTYKRTCAPLEKNTWDKILESLDLLKKFSCNTVIRLTLVKDVNMISPEKYAALIEKSKPTFIEIKAFMSVSFARERLPFESMPHHKEIVEFAKAIEKHSSYKIKDEQKESRVVLLGK